jgi:hypothetical protein
LAEVNTVVGRELAWQSMHDVGCAVPSGAWKVAPEAHLASAACVGLMWQVLQSCVTIGVVVGWPFCHTTASWRISPEAGVRVLAVGPTKPVGMVAAWQSAHWLGAGSAMFASVECKTPG